jgi:murein L,D-transpeptidase YafK
LWSIALRNIFTRILKPLVSLFALFTLAACTTGLEDNRHNVPLSSFTKARLSQMGSSEGAPMIVRIFKHESELEVWKEVKKTGKYELFRTYKICAWSGELGPKFREGDRQSPEGFYDISPGLMNPKSSYYLAYNTGFPNKFDRAHGRTGSNLMVHGDCSSRGCYAMTDEQIAEIYALLALALLQCDAISPLPHPLHFAQFVALQLCNLPQIYPDVHYMQLVRKHLVLRRHIHQRG